MVFANIEYLFLLLLLIPYIVWYILKQRKSEATLQISDARVYALAPKSYKNYLLHLPFILRIAAITLIIIVLARPQTTDKWQNSEIEGIDIMLAIDVSTSMLAEDLKPNRLESAKEVAAEFINGRPNDNIGITLFAGESFTQCPLTVDHAVLLNLIKDTKCGLIEDGTAVGMGIANAVTRLKDSKAKSKVIILLTDGTNNRGDISPLTAAEIAKSFGIRVYTIGVGTNGTAPYPYPVGGTVQYVNMPVEIDEQTLTQIAATTDADYFRATSNSKLKEVYTEIDKLEKTKLNVKEFSKREEEFRLYALIAFLCLLLEVEKGATIILSTHNMESVEELCDNIALFNKSHVVITGGVDEIRRKHGNNNVELIYTAQQPVTSVEGLYKVLSDQDDSGRHTAVLALENGVGSNDVLKDIIAQGVAVNSFKELVPRMNDIFIKLVTEEE